MDNKTLKKRSSDKVTIGVFCLALLSSGSAVYAAESVTSTAKVGNEPTPATVAKEPNVKSTAKQEVDKLRQGLVKEAITANHEMQQAISLLEKKDNQGAFKALEKADGEMSVVLARDSHLKLAAIGVRANVVDLESKPDAIKKAVKEAKKELDHGDIQAARTTLSPLVSEMYIDTDYVPLAIYPDAIERASRQIQESKVQDAKSTLTDAMSSIVTLTDAIPLPPIKAEGDMLQAEQLQKQDKVKNKDKVLSLLADADNNLADAKALGYGKYRDIRKEIDAIESKVKSGSDKPDMFQRAKKMFDNLIHGHKSKA